MDPERSAQLNWTVFPLGQPRKGTRRLRLTGVVTQGSPRQEKVLFLTGRPLDMVLVLTYSLSHSANVYGGLQVPGPVVGAWQTMLGHSDTGPTLMELWVECGVVKFSKGSRSKYFRLWGPFGSQTTDTTVVV